MTILFIIFSIIISLLLGHYIYINHFIRKLQKIPPSPVSLPILGHLHHLKDPLHQTLSNTTNKVGPITLLRFGHRLALHITSPSAAEECLRHSDIIFANRPRLLTGDILGYNSKTLIWAPYGNLWRNLRRISTVHIFSLHSLQLSAGIRSEEVRSLLQRIKNQSQRGQTVAIGEGLFEMTQRVMMRVLAKEGYKWEGGKYFREIIEELMRVEGTFTMVDVFPWLKFLGVKWGLKKKFRELGVKKEKVLDDLLEKSKKNGNMIEGEDEDSSGISSNRLRRGLIEVLVTLQKSEPEFYTDEIIKGLFQVLLLAGTDTSAGTIEWALSLMLNNPRVLKKAQHEITSRVGHDRLIQESDLSTLPYIRCIVLETLRLYPAAPLLIPHESSEKCIIGGYEIPRGTMLLVNVWAIQNDPKYWAEPKEFRPERFEGVEKDEEQMKYIFMPFGSGRRACPGEGMAMRMVGLTLGALLQCFAWERPGPNLIDMGVKNGLSMPKAQPLKAKCQPYKSTMHLMNHT